MKKNFVEEIQNYILITLSIELKVSIDSIRSIQT